MGIEIKHEVYQVEMGGGRQGWKYWGTHVPEHPSLGTGAPFQPLDDVCSLLENQLQGLPRFG